MLSYDSGYDSPTIDLNLPAALTAADLDFSKPASNQNNSSGNTVKSAVDNVLALLEGGAAAYDIVNSKIAGASDKANAQQQLTAPVVVSPGNPAFVFGLSTNQLLLIAGGLAAVLILPRLFRK